MGIDPLTDLSKRVKLCAQICLSKSTKTVCQIYCRPRPPPPPIPVEIHTGFNEKELLTSIFVILSCVLGGAIILGILLALCRECCYDSRRRRSSRGRNPNPPAIFVTEEQFVDEERVIDHPIWYINTVGLQQSVIDLISVVNYKKHEGLIEGTDCSVCLGEFLDDEGLRILPKCSHAFHISCIDTWLRSHKNCPLCRAPIVNEAVVIAQSDSVVSLGEENRVGDLESEVELRTIGAEEVFTSNENREYLPIEEKNHAQNSGDG